KNAKLIFNVSDLWPESAEKLGVVTNKQLLKMAYRLEAKLYKKSALVTGQTQGICKNINERFPQVKTFWLPNGVDLEMYNPDSIASTNWRKENGFNDIDFIVLYAGIIGIAQGLEVILKAAKQTISNSTIKYVLLGSGPEKEKLMSLNKQMELTNVYFVEGVSKDKIKGILKEVNAAVIPLRKLDLFLGAIPSKVFENLAMKIPVLLGVDGEAKLLFVDYGKCALYFEPENDVMLAEQVTKLAADENLIKTLGKNGRAYVNEFFNRNNIASLFYEELKKLN
ncbi:MAG: glycosyltransferase family 4 protein, partial [Bacteroidia bacterium]|nr:glycosyltransferase family 4 protein [Bacteroidia bacterium]